jgi:hypothetical protein
VRSRLGCHWREKRSGQGQSALPHICDSHPHRRRTNDSRLKTYPLRLILSALSDYDLGYTLEKTAARLQKKSGWHVSPSTVTSWLNEYHRHCTYRRLRADGLRHFPPEQTIRSIKLYHRQVYGYAYHRPKLDFVRTGTLDDKRTGDARFGAFADFLESVPISCPHDLLAADTPIVSLATWQPLFVAWA